MIVACISDTHELHREVDLPPGDLLIHAGDLTLFSQSHAALRDFNEWLGELPYRHKVIVPGNHDTLLESGEMQSEITNGHLLINRGIVLGGIPIWGSPMMPLAAGAFAIPDEVERAKVWATIPTETQILITHTPPARILDADLDSDQHAGCTALRREFKRIHPKLHVFGHVHSAAGIYQTERIMFVNAALASPLGDLARDPILLQIKSLDFTTDSSPDHELSPLARSQSLPV